MIAEIARSCKTQVLEVFGPLLLLKDVVSLKHQLTKLIFYVEKSQTAIEMPICLDGDKILKVLNLYEKCLSKDSVEAFAKALKHHNISGSSSAHVKLMKFHWIVKIGILKGIAKLLLSFYILFYDKKG